MNFKQSLRDKGKNDEAQQISDKLNEHLKIKNKKISWWKKMF